MAPSILAYCALGAFTRFMHLGLTGRTIASEGIPSYLAGTAVMSGIFGLGGYALNKAATEKLRLSQREVE
ncbi:uncharacterized protein V1518DRAFT_418289 [Limtongia smithiae]|uniref:uncharacterized protein n=1 Tax=Limtongia smithiae TaxID=1125753 RepID=UPI0034CF5B0B